MKERNNFCDNIKGVLILLVVIAHFMVVNGNFSQAVYNGIYLFHMPLFIYISGMFHNNDKIRERVTGLVLIGVVYSTLLIIIDNVIFKQQQVFYIFRATKIPWYVFTIAICSLVTYLVRDYKRSVVLAVAVFIALCACYDGNLMQYMSVSKAVGWFPFYYLGTITNREKLENYSKRPVFICTGTVILLLFIILIFCNKQFPIITKYAFLYGVQSQFETLSLKWIPIKAIYYLAVIIVSGAVICVVPHRRIPVLTYLGKKTMQIYFWHIPIRSFVSASGIAETVFGSHIGKIVWAILSAALTVVLSAKVFEFPTAFIFRGMRKQN